MSYGERVAFARGFFAPEYEARHLDDLEDQLAHELMDDVERQELRDRVLALRRKLGLYSGFQQH
jgi:hypothetical protein